MSFHEHGITACGHGCPRQSGDQLPLSAGRGSPRRLHAVSGVIDHRDTERLHDRNAAEVIDQAAISKCCSSLAEHDVAESAGFTFADSVPGIFRGNKLRLLDVDGRSVLHCSIGGRNQQVGLPGQEGGNLQNRTDFSNRGCLSRFVDIGCGGQPCPLADFFKQSQPSFQSRTAIALNARSIGLVKAGFEHNLQAVCFTQPGKSVRHAQYQFLGFHHAGTKNEQQRFCAATAVVSNGDGRSVHFGHLSGIFRPTPEASELPSTGCSSDSVPHYTNAVQKQANPTLIGVVPVAEPTLQQVTSVRNLVFGYSRDSAESGVGSVGGVAAADYHPASSLQTGLQTGSPDNVVLTPGFRPSGSALFWLFRTVLTVPHCTD